MSYTLVVIESPYAPSIPYPTSGCRCDAAGDPSVIARSVCCNYCTDRAQWHYELSRNIAYARDAMKDSLNRGEAPFVSHLLYTQPDVLDDTIPEEREHGIRAGWAWRQVAQKTVVYTDLGISGGMQYGIDDANDCRCLIEYRSLPDWADEKESSDGR